MLPSQTLSLTIPRNWVDLYETIRKPELFPQWVSALNQAELEPDGTNWKTKETKETIKIRFTEHNVLGVLDFWIDPGFGNEVYFPLRIVANEEGAEVIITHYRQPLTSDEKFAEELEQIKQDLDKLLHLMTC